MLNYETQQGLNRVRELLKQWSIFIYTGRTMDDLVLMDVELEGLWEEKYIESQVYMEMKLILRKAIREAEEQQ